MKTIKGPGIFLAQFVGAEKPFNNLKSICEWASNLGYKAVQIPTWEEGLIDLKKASESKTYCDELNGIVNEAGALSFILNLLLEINTNTIIVATYGAMLKN